MPNPSESLNAHKRILVAALELGSPDATFLLQRHFALKGSIRKSRPGSAVGHDLVDLLLDFGHVGLASDAWAKTQAAEKLNFAPIEALLGNNTAMKERLQGVQGLMSARYFQRIGDWHSVENIFENAIKSINSLQSANGLPMTGMPFASPYLFYPDLAKSKLELRKPNEAKALIETFFDNQKKFEKDSKTFFEKISGKGGRFPHQLMRCVNSLVVGGCLHKAEMVSMKLEAMNKNYILTTESIQKASQGLALIIDGMTGIRSLSTPDYFSKDAFEQRVASIREDFYATVAAQLLEQGSTELLDKISNEWLESSGSKTAPSISRLLALQSRAWACRLMKKTEDFRKSVSEVTLIQEKIGRSIITIGSDDQKIAWLKASDPFSLAASLGDTDMLASVIIGTKGVVMDSIRQGKFNVFNKSETIDRFDLFELQRLENKLLMGYLSGSPDSEQTQTDVNALKNRIFGGRDLQVASSTLEQVQQSMEKDALYLDYFRYRSLKDTGGWTEMYGLLVIDSLEGAKFFPLGEAMSIDQVVGDILTFEDKLPTNWSVESILKRAYDKLILPIDPLLQNRKHLIVSPDSALNSVPFSMLLNHEKIFLVDRFNISFAGSARDVIGTAQPAPLTGSALIVSNPAYLSAASNNGSKSAPASNVNQLPFDKENLPASPPLPGSELEAQQVKAIFKDLGINAYSLESYDANEQRVTNELNKNYSFLHLATHGYVLKPSASSISSASSPDLMQEYRVRGDGEKHGPTAMLQQSLSVSGRIRDRPMSRAMLALSNCQNTFEHWKNGRVPEPATDGLLSAAELAGCDLSNVYLAVLSACSSGAGEALRGDGILGLRRAFFVAGCKNLLVTSWPLADSYPQDFFDKFYRSLNQSRDAVDALNQTQRGELKRILDEEGMATAVYKAGTFSIWNKR